MRIVLRYFYPLSRLCVTPDDFFTVEAVDRFQDSTVGIMAANSADGGGERTAKSRTFKGGMQLDTIKHLFPLVETATSKAASGRCGARVGWPPRNVLHGDSRQIALRKIPASRRSRETEASGTTDLSRVGEIFFRPFGAWILGNLSTHSLCCGPAGHGHSSAASRLDSGGRRFSHGDAYMEMRENPASRKGRQTWGTGIHFSASIGSTFVARSAGR